MYKEEKTQLKFIFPTFSIATLFSSMCYLLLVKPMLTGGQFSFSLNFYDYGHMLPMAYITIAFIFVLNFFIVYIIFRHISKYYAGIGKSSTYPIFRTAIVTAVTLVIIAIIIGNLGRNNGPGFGSGPMLTVIALCTTAYLYIIGELSQLLGRFILKLSQKNIISIVVVIVSAMFIGISVYMYMTCANWSSSNCTIRVFTERARLAADTSWCDNIGENHYVVNEIYPPSSENGVNYKIHPIALCYAEVAQVKQDPSLCLRALELNPYISSYGSFLKFCSKNIVK